MDVRRISTQSTDTKLAAEQVKALARRNPRPKVITADSRHRNRHFLDIFAHLENTYALVRLQNNQKLSEAPVPKPKGSRGATRNRQAPVERDEQGKDKQREQKRGKGDFHPNGFGNFAGISPSASRANLLTRDAQPMSYNYVRSFMQRQHNLCLG